MKKIAILVIFYILLSLGFATETEKTLSLYKGWNLVSNGLNIEGCSDSIESVFYYSPIKKQYYGYNYSNRSYYPNENDALRMIKSEYKTMETEDVSNIYYYGYPQLGAIFVYAKNNCLAKVTSSYTLKANFDNSFFKKHPLKEGWNFISIAPWMEGKDLKSILRNCKVEGINVWDGYKKKWGYKSSSEAVKQILESPTTNNISNNAIGSTLAIKVANDCPFIIEEILPPSIPT